MKILLLAYGKYSQPYGLIDIYGYLSSRGYKVEYKHLAYQKLKASFVPDYVGITVYTLISPDAKNIIAKVRKKWPNAKIILGGRHFCEATLYDSLIKLADYVVIGEGEYAIEKIVKGETAKIVYGTQLSKQDYDNIPTLKVYRGKYLTGCILSRGCPFNCLFCCDQRKPVIRVEPDTAVEHIERLIAWSGNDYVYIYDDIFSINKTWLNDFRKELVKQKVKPRIECFIHAKYFNKELLELLKACGVVYMNLGAESGDNRILDLIDKNTTVDDYWNVHDLARKTDITLHALWMMCNVGETYESIEKTIKLSRQVGTNRSHFSYAIPFPDTKFWKVANDYGQIIEPDFSKWDANETMVFLPNGLEKKKVRKLFKKATKE